MQSPSRMTPWVSLVSGPSPRRIRLFYFPYAGGGTSAIRPWARRLPPGVELALVQLPGREARMREAAVPRLGRLLDPLVEGLRPYLEGPFAFFGHSMGSIIAFEAARRLQAEGGPAPRLLVASGHRSPQAPFPHEPIYPLAHDQLVAALQRLGGTPQEVLANPELLELVLPTLRADFELDETYTYVPGEPLRCPVTAYGGLADPDVSRSDLEAWAAVTTGRFQLRLFPGNHFFLHTAEAAVLQALALDLAPLLGPPA